MTAEPSELPPPPRRIARRAILAFRWPLGLVGGFVCVFATVMGLVLLAGDDFRSPFPDWDLDAAGELARREATVEQVTAVGMRLRSHAVWAIDYSFPLDEGGARERGRCYALDGPWRPGQQRQLEYLPHDVTIHRLRGTTRSRSALWLGWYLPWLWGPAVLLFAFWLVGCWRTAVVLRHGRAVPARLLSARTTRFTNPPQVVVRYAFDAGHDGEQRGWRWLPRRSPLAELVLALRPGDVLPGLQAVFLEERPGRHRLLPVADAEAGS